MDGLIFSFVAIQHQDDRRNAPRLSHESLFKQLTDVDIASAFAASAVLLDKLRSRRRRRDCYPLVS